MLHSVVILSCLVGAYAQTITDATYFIGYYQSGSSYVTATCPATTATFATSGAYWGCSPYPSAGLGLVTGCTSGTLLLPGGNSQYQCQPGFECNTGYLFSNLNDQSPLSEYGCYTGPRTTTYYRSLPASVLAGATGSTGATTSASSTQTTSAAGVSSSSQTSLTAGTTSPTTPPPTGGGHSSSKAWIAGAVIGPILGIALVVGVGLWIWSHRRRAKQGQLTPHQHPEAESGKAELPDSGPGPDPTAPSAPTEEQKGTWVFVPAETPTTAPQTGPPPPGWSPGEHELPTQSNVPELPSQHNPVELESGSKKI